MTAGNKNHGQKASDHDTNFLLHNQAFIKLACDKLIKKDKRIKKLLAATGLPEVTPREMIGFASFVNILISQQISNAAAASITKKFLALVIESTPRNILKYSSEELRAVGLSRQKIERIQLLAAAALAGDFQPDNLVNLSTSDVISHIVKQKGFGDWSGEVFALFSLGRSDVFPKGDLALQLAHQHLYELPKRPSAKELEERARAWQPYRSVVALLLWDYYGKVVKKTPKEQLAKNLSNKLRGKMKRNKQESTQDNAA